MFPSLTLTELMCARFCHDLAGPVSAVNNGLEFLHEDNEAMKMRALELVEASSKEAVIRLQFFRQAYGVASAQGEADISQLRNMAAQFFSMGKISLDWPDQHTEAAGISLSNRMGRLALNLLIVASTALIYGGTISVRLTKDGDSKHITVTASGKELKIWPEISGIFSGQEHPLDKRTVQMHFTAQLAAQSGMGLTVIPGQDSLQLVAKKSAQYAEALPQATGTGF